MRTRQKIESELDASERDKAVARLSGCRLRLAIPIDFQMEFDGANRADTSIPAHPDRSTGGVFGGK
jgi:hypothetical protein